jgi:hypothetical protein
MRELSAFFDLKNADKTITEEEGYQAMLLMLGNWWKDSGSDELTHILSGGGIDSTFWSYWCEAVKEVRYQKEAIDKENLSLIQQFVEGEQFVLVNRLSLIHESEFDLSVRGGAPYAIFSDLTKIGVLEQLERVKSTFDKLCIMSENLRNLISGKTITYIVRFEGAAGGPMDMSICRETNGKVTWLIDINDA